MFLETIRRLLKDHKSKIYKRLSRLEAPWYIIDNIIMYIIRVYRLHTREHGLSSKIQNKMHRTEELITVE